MSDEQAVRVGDRFLRTRAPSAGRVFEVYRTDALGVDLPGYGWSQETTLTGGEYGWRRVPPGYIVPPVGDLLTGADRLVLAYRAMLADPETGAKGIDATVREMARLGGIEVTW